MAEVFEGTWWCPECGDQYTRNLGRCSNLGGCSRPRLARLSPAATVSREDGLTDAEGAVADALCEAVSRYARLPVEHRDEPGDFARAIHRCQDLLAIRIARRHYPEGWPYKTAERLGDAR